jgi:PTS system fructose-specific IIA component/PTS system nitrogen regulatory IIA component
MKFAEFVCTDAIRAQLLAVDKQGVIREMVQALVDAGRIAEEHQESIAGAILQREELGSTGMGRGAAIPHAKHSSIENTVAAVMVSQSGINFDSIDGEPVFLFCLLISPLSNPSDHLKALECTATHFRMNTFCSFLRQATTVDDIKQLLNESDGS